MFHLYLKSSAESAACIDGCLLQDAGGVDRLNDKCLVSMWWNTLCIKTLSRCRWWTGSFGQTRGGLLLQYSDTARERYQSSEECVAVRAGAVATDHSWLSPRGLALRTILIGNCTLEKHPRQLGHMGFQHSRHVHDKATCSSRSRRLSVDRVTPVWWRQILVFDLFLSCKRSCEHPLPDASNFFCRTCVRSCSAETHLLEA